MTIRRSIPLALAALGCGFAIVLLASGDDEGDSGPDAPPEPGPLAQLANGLDQEYKVSAIAESELRQAARPVRPQARSPSYPVAGLRFDLPGSSDAFLFIYGEPTEPEPGKNLALWDAVTSFYGVSGCGPYLWFIEGEKESPGEDWIRHVGKALASDRAGCRGHWSVIA